MVCQTAGGTKWRDVGYTVRMAKKEPAFEESFRQLEDIVRKLETGGLPLDESVSLFEEAMRLAKACNARLDGAELRITQITLQQGPAAHDDEEADEAPFDPEAVRNAL